jgi:pilus assembly protein CpaF
MMNFYPNPIVVKNNGVPSRLIGLDYDVEEKDFILEVLDKNRTLIQKHRMDLNTLISLDKEYGEIMLVYRDLEGNVLKTRIIDLLKDEEDAYDAYVENTDSELEMILENMVKEQMDYPSGTPAEIANHTEMLKKATMDKNARLYVTSKIRNIIVSSNLVKPEEVEKYVYKIYANLYGMGVLQELDDDETVGEIMVNATVFPTFKSDIYYIKEGKKYKYHKEFRNLEELKNVFSRAVEFNKKELNSVENAIVEATRANRDRVNIIIPEASESYVMNIRKFSNFVPNLEMMRKYGTVDDYIDKLMRVLVKGKANIGIGGEMGTGKTTFINFLLTYTEPIERKVVIASVAETDVHRVLKGHDVVILNVNEEKDFTFDRLIRTSLRTTASRIIVPESRGGEFKQVYEANLKTKGNMFTAHALDDESFLDMCVDMYLDSSETTNESSEYIKNKLAKSIDIVIIMRKVGEKIRIKSISEVLLDEKRNYAGMNLLYKWDFDPENPLEGQYKATGNKLTDALKRRLNENGVPMSQLRDL